MGRLRQPELSGQLKALSDSLHDLHLQAGQPSVREIQSAIGRETASHSRIYDVFSSTRLPAWGMVDVIIEFLCSRTPGLSESVVRPRLHALWVAASQDSDDTSALASPPHTVQASRLALLPAVSNNLHALSDVLQETSWVRADDARRLAAKLMWERTGLRGLRDAQPLRIWIIELWRKTSVVPDGPRVLAEVSNLLDGVEREFSAVTRYVELILYPEAAAIDAQLVARYSTAEINAQLADLADLADPY